MCRGRKRGGPATNDRFWLASLGGCGGFHFKFFDVRFRTVDFPTLGLSSMFVIRTQRDPSPSDRPLCISIQLFFFKGSEPISLELHRTFIASLFAFSSAPV